MKVRRTVSGAIAARVLWLFVATSAVACGGVAGVDMGDPDAATPVDDSGSPASDASGNDPDAVVADGAVTDRPGQDVVTVDDAARDVAVLGDAPVAPVDAPTPDSDASTPGPDASGCVALGCAGGACALTLNVDVPAATVSGRLTQGGATWPTTSTRSGVSGEATVEFMLRAHDTQVLHRIAAIGYGTTAPYTRPAGSDSYTSTVIPGTYDLVYRRGVSRGDVSGQFNRDPVLTGFRVLRTVTVSPGAQRLDIDVPVATVSGRITQGGATWPTTSSLSGTSVEATAEFMLRSQDTQVLHWIAAIDYSTTAPYTRRAGSDAYTSTVIPGTYDLVYRRGVNRGDVSSQFNRDAVLTGFRVLRTVTVSPGAQTLDIDVPVATVSGRLTQGGVTWPMTSARSGTSVEATAEFMLRAHDTQVLHRIAAIGYGTTAPYTRPAGSDSYTSTVIPGTYDLVYRRGVSGGDVSGQFSRDAVLTGFRVLRTVTVTPGAQTLDIDVPLATVSGRITQGGATWPTTSTRSGTSVEATAEFMLRAQDTQALHRIAAIDYSTTAPYTRTAGSDMYASTVIPGTYDLVYRRGVSRGDVSGQFNRDAVLTGFRVLRTVTVSPGAQTLDIDVPVATVSGRITQGGATWPTTSTRSGISVEATAEFMLRAQDTQALHRIAAIDYSTTAPYTRPAGSDSFTSTVIPGTYDLVYRRAWSAGEVSGQFNRDAVLTGFRVLRTVTIAPGSQTLNIDLPVVTVSGRMTLGGAIWPTTTTRSGVSANSSPELFLRARDTLALHRIASISYGTTAPYTRPAGSDAFSTTLLPGVYDLVYRRAESDGDVSTQFNSDPVVNGYRVLRTCVSVP